MILSVRVVPNAPRMEVAGLHGKSVKIRLQAAMPRVGFTLIELLVAVVIMALLAGMGGAAYLQAISAAERSESLAKLRTMGQAIHLYATERDGQLPGPLWPGQVMLYDKNREGRLVRDLADYLNVEQREIPYVVDDLIPRACQKAMRGTDLGNVRVYVMNTSIDRDGSVLTPFGSLTGSSPVPSMKLPAMTDLPEDDRWMLSEADQEHPDVAAAPWKANTPAKPVYGTRRAVLYFDGSAELEKVAD